MERNHFENDCIFCNIGRGSLCENKIENTIISETPDFLIIPALGPLTEGHVLMITKQHYHNFFEIPDSIIDEFHQCKRHICNKLESIYGKILIFEHGNIDNSKINAGASIKHAHLHILPDVADLLPQLTTLFQYKKLKSVRLSIMTENKPYLYYEKYKRGSWIFYVEKSLPTQFLRKMLSNFIGKNEAWDWQRFPSKDLVNNTLKKLDRYSTD